MSEPCRVSRLEILTSGYIRSELGSDVECRLKIIESIVAYGKMKHILGIDLSYSINKKSYNLLSSKDIIDFCTKSNTNNSINGVYDIGQIVSFGDDNYGLIDCSNNNITGFVFNEGRYDLMVEFGQKSLNALSNNLNLQNTTFTNAISSSSVIALFDNDAQNLELINLKKESHSQQQFRVKSSIEKVFKHLLLTANGSLYGLRGSFHKKYFNNKRIIDVQYDGYQTAVCLDENGALWSFGNNSFGKLGLTANTKKQIYTNPRQISLFKAFKVTQFGVTNRCVMAVCANRNVYGWGCYKNTNDEFNRSDIWYTPQLLSPNDPQIEYKIYSGFRFFMLLDQENNNLYVSNTEFGFKVDDKADKRTGLIINTEKVRLPLHYTVDDIIPSNESAIIVASG